jgi:uncharacterized protein
VRERRPDRVRGIHHDEFWSFAASDELRLQRCGSCRHISWPCVDSCENCGSDVLIWERLTGKGKVISWCTFEKQYYSDLPVPWDTILVELEEGPCFISNPHGFRANDITPGMAVKVTFLDCEDEGGAFRLPVFERCDEPTGSS